MDSHETAPLLHTAECIGVHTGADIGADSGSCAGSCTKAQAKAQAKAQVGAQAGVKISAAPAVLHETIAVDAAPAVSHETTAVDAAPVVPHETIAVDADTGMSCSSTACSSTGTAVLHETAIVDLCSDSRELAHARYSGVQDDDAVRALCLGDLFYLMVAGMGRSDMDNDWCFARCREVQANPDGYLDLWAREHYKSTIITIGLTIQNILGDPELTVGIFSHTRPMAKSFLRQIKREFEQNMQLQHLFPHIIPPKGKTSRSWSEDTGLVLVRSTNPKEATVEAWGLVDGQPTGKHFSLLVYDDVVTRESVTTPDQIKKTTGAWELSLNLGAHGGKRRMIGTRYHHFDTWQEILERGAAMPRIHPATHDGTALGDPVFLDRDILLQKRRDQGPYTFGAQMLQNPTAESAQGFMREWFKTVPENFSHAGHHYYIVVDPAGECKKDSDYTVMWVVALGADQNFYVVDGVRDRLNLTARAEALFRLHKKYHPLAVGYEKYGQQADIEHIKDSMARSGYLFPIMALGGSMPKNDRIRRLVPLFEEGRIFFCRTLLYFDTEGRTRDLTQEFVQEEFCRFPVARHDDMLDCLARIIDPDLNIRFPGAYKNIPGQRARNSFEEEFFKN